MYSTTPDRHFVIGWRPHCGDVTAACGFSGRGFKFVPVIGEVLADLASNGDTELPISMFEPRRFVA